MVYRKEVLSASKFEAMVLKLTEKKKTASDFLKRILKLHSNLM